LEEIGSENWAEALDMVKSLGMAVRCVLWVLIFQSSFQDTAPLKWQTKINKEETLI
jgi:hypothetical protein